MSEPNTQNMPVADHDVFDGGDDLTEDHGLDHEDADYNEEIDDDEAGEAAQPDDDDSSEAADLSDDPAVSASIDILTSLGIDPQGRELYAAGSGDFSFLEEFARSLRGAERKRAETALNLLKDARTRWERADEMKREEEERHVHKIAGGKKEWASLQRFAEKHADKAELNDIEAALNMGGQAATMAVRYLQVCKAMRDAGGDTEAVAEAQGASSVIKPAAKANRGNGEVIDEKWYSTKVKALAAKYGNTMVDTPEFARVNAAWAAARNRRAYR